MMSCGAAPSLDAKGSEREVDVVVAGDDSLDRNAALLGERSQWWTAFVHERGRDDEEERHVLMSGLGSGHGHQPGLLQSDAETLRERFDDHCSRVVPRSCV